VKNKVRSVWKRLRLNLFFYLFETYFLSCSDMIEALAVDADDGALCHEGLGIDLVDEVEDDRRLALFGEAEEDLDGSLRIEPVAVERGAAAVGDLVDSLADLLPSLGDDKELDGAVEGVDDIVDAERDDEEQHVAVEHLLPVAQHHVARGDDRQVAEKDDVTQGDVAVLVDHRRHDIGAACAAACREAEAHARTHEHATDDARHELLVSEEVGVGAAEPLEDSGGHGEDCHGIDRLDAETPAEDHQSCDEQAGIDNKISVLGRDARAPVHNLSDTHRAAHRDLVGHEEEVQSNDAHEHGYGDDGVVADGPED